ncbi:hypothetical protein [Aeromonas media]|uniref:hypothetical protein n=1 Tax=Aeromonas media TaxID=651 RepID=UPI003D1F3EBA
MNMIQNIKSKKELSSFKSHVGKILAENLSLNLKAGRLNEVTAKLLGVNDWNTALGMFKEPQKCKCGEPLNGLGYCIDERCVNHFWTQEESQTEDNRRIKIMATFHSLDYGADVKFDASEFFTSLEDHLDIEDVVSTLHKEQWGYCELTYEIAWFIYNLNSPESQHERIVRLIDGATMLGDASDGFSVSIDVKTMHNWLNKHHPSLAHYAA